MSDTKFFRVCVSSEYAHHYIVESTDLESAEQFVIENKDKLKPIYKSENETITSYKTKGDFE